MKTASIAEDVALILSLPYGDPGNDESPYATGFRRRVELEVERCAAEALRSLPHTLLTGWLPLPKDELLYQDDHTALLPLPDDFLLFHTLRMESWKAPAVRVDDTDPTPLPIRFSIYDAVRPSEERPIVWHTLSPEGEPALGIAPANVGEEMREGWYLPAPKIKAGEIKIPPAAYHDVLNRIAEALRVE